MLCFVFIKSQSESLKAFQWVPRFVLHYARDVTKRENGEWGMGNEK